MAKTKKIRIGRHFIAGAIIVVLGVIGTSYATWTKEHSVNAKLSTDKFDFMFGEKGYTADLVDQSGSSKDVLDFSVNIIDKRGMAELAFTSGIPKELLDDGNYIRISYPVQSVRTGDKMALLEYDVDFAKKEDLVFHASGSYIAHEGSVYEYANLPADFTKDLTFHVYRSMKKMNGSYVGSMYLELSDESKDAIAAFPTELVLDSNVSDLVAVGLTSKQDGVLIDYSAQISFYLEQFNKKEDR